MLKGSVIAQLIGTVGGLYIAKIYGSESYGIFGVFFSVASIFAIINTLQLEFSIVLSKSITSKKQIISFLIVISILIPLFLAFAIYVLQSFTSNYYSTSIILLGIFGSYLLSQIIILENSLIAENRFNKIAFSKILLSFFTIFFQCIFFKISPNKGLILGFLSSIFIVSVYYFLLNFNKLVRLNIQTIRIVLKKNKNLLKYALPSNLINAIANNIMPILIMAYFSTSESASYFLSIKLLGIPLFFITNAVSSPYFQTATKLYESNNSRLYFFTKKIVKSNILIMLFLLFVIDLIIVFCLDWYFDKSWPYLIPYTLLLNLLFIAKSIFTPISTIIEITIKNHIGLYFNIYLLIINLAAIIVANHFNSSIYSVTILSLFGSIGYLALYFYFINYIKHLNP